MTVHPDPQDDPLHRSLVDVTRCLRVFLADYFDGCAIKRDPHSIAPYEFEQVHDDILAVIEAKRLVWIDTTRDYDDRDGEFLDACLAEFQRREQDEADNAC